MWSGHVFVPDAITEAHEMLDDQYDLEMPDRVRAVAVRHEQHITKLIEQLRSFGMEEKAIQRSVDELIASYRAELVEAIKAFAGGRDG